MATTSSAEGSRVPSATRWIKRGFKWALKLGLNITLDWRSQPLQPNRCGLRFTWNIREGILRRWKDWDQSSDFRFKQFHGKEGVEISVGSPQGTTCNMLRALTLQLTVRYILSGSHSRVCLDYSQLILLSLGSLELKNSSRDNYRQGVRPNEP